MSKSVKSHPMWVRGLKPVPEFDNNGFEGSHPMWVRGLKLRLGKRTCLAIQSHPMWVRGLKPLTQHIVVQ